MSEVSGKDYVDALLAERDRTNNARLLGIVGTSAAMFFGLLTAVRVYSETNREQFKSHNDLIRKGERDYAGIKAEMATKAQVAPLEADVSRRQGSSVTTAKMVGYLFATATFALAAGVAGANYFG